MKRYALTALPFVIMFVTILVPSSAHAQSGENVAVVINGRSADSRRIGDYYAKARQVPAPNVIRIETSVEDSISRTAYANEVEGPIAEAIRRANLHDQILYIVLTKGVPLRITGTEGRNGTVASVDSELTLLYRRMTGRIVPTVAKVPNPYYLGPKPIESAAPFSRRQHDIYLVTRLTAFTADEAIALIDRARSAVPEGSFVLDQRAGVLDNPVGDRHLAEAQRRLIDLGLRERVVLESTTDPARDVDGVLGYYSWGSNDPENRVRQTTMRFRPGALAAMFLSQDARTFDEPPAEWKPSNDQRSRTAQFQGSTQSLIGDLVREGVTGVAGHVAEPYLESAVQPQILFPAYVTGLNLAEAFYLAMPDLSWRAVVVGDPLCAAFTRRGLTRDDLEARLDDATGLPAVFAARRLEVAMREFKGIPAPAVSLFIRGESHFALDDAKAARTALEAGIKSAPDFVAARLLLARVLEIDEAFAEAAAQYREVLRVQPSNILALNNLAYHLAVRQGEPAEARTLARRAFVLAPNNILIADTLAWVEHLTGNSNEAATLYRKYAPRNTGNHEVHLHAATVFAAVGDLRTAAAQLAIAVSLNPEAESSPEAQHVRELLKKRAGGGPA